jgi:hypothetical protein
MWAQLGTIQRPLDYESNVYLYKYLIIRYYNAFGIFICIVNAHNQQTDLHKQKAGIS